jgi:hypothetical protein
MTTGQALAQTNGQAREQPHRSRKSLVELAHPGQMQAAGGLDGEDWAGVPGVVDDQPVNWSRPGRKARQLQLVHHRAGLNRPGVGAGSNQQGDWTCVCTTEV